MPKQKITGQPIQYQRGFVEFYRLKFKVTPDVLIPRPETELLVDTVLSYCKLYPEDCPLILDIGTGSGNIAISTVKHLPTPNVGIQVIATDISKKALKIARLNAKYHQLENKIDFIHSDLLADLFDPDLIGTDLSGLSSSLIVVTNLPYIPSARIPYLDSSVKDYEPHIALDGGEDGFELYRQLFKQLKHLITHRRCNQVFLVGEIDYTHGELAVNEALKHFPMAQVEVKTDLAHKQRILTIRAGQDLK